MWGQNHTAQQGHHDVTGSWLPRAYLGGYHLAGPRGSGGCHILLGDLGGGHVGHSPGEAGRFCSVFSYVCVLDRVVSSVVSPQIHMLES